MATYYATLTYDPNDGTSSWSETLTTENASSPYVTFSLPTLSRTGYTFNGWVFNGSTYTGSITLYATYNGASYSVSGSWTERPTTYNIYSTNYFDANGGSPSAQTTLQGVSSTTDGYLTGVAPTAPTRNGYTFGGWQLGSTVRQPGEQYTVYATTSGTSYTWVAIWTPTTYTVTISFDSDGGTPTPSSISGSYTTPDTYVELRMPSAPTKAGYNFEGWGTQLFIPGRDYPFTAGTYTLVAQWSVVPVTGKVKLYDNGWQSAKAYVYTSNGWKEATVWVFDGNSWVSCNG